MLREHSEINETRTAWGGSLSLKLEWPTPAVTMKGTKMCFVLLLVTGVKQGKCLPLLLFKITKLHVLTKAIISQRLTVHMTVISDSDLVRTTSVD